MLYYDELIKPFLGSDTNRPALMQANQEGDTVYASNAHIMIYMPAYRLIHEYPPHEKAPDFKKVINDLVELPVPMRFTDSAVFDALSRLTKIPDKTICKECKGEGQIMCTYCKHVHECELCEGEGLQEENGIDMTYDSQSAYIKIMHSFFQPNSVGKLETVLAKLFADDCLLTHAAPQKGYLFKVNDVCVVMMPLHEYETDFDGRPVYELKPVD